jgi:hypothetical protein
MPNCSEARSPCGFRGRRTAAIAGGPSDISGFSTPLRWYWLGQASVTQCWGTFCFGLIAQPANFGTRAYLGVASEIYGDNMEKKLGKKKEKCKNCEGKGTLKKGNKVVRCQRCDGTGIKR